MYMFLYNFASAKSDLPPHNTLYNKENNDIWWHPLMPLYIIRVFFIDFMYHFSQWRFQSVGEAVETIVFNPNFIFELEYSKGF